MRAATFVAALLLICLFAVIKPSRAGGCKGDDFFLPTGTSSIGVKFLGNSGSFKIFPNAGSDSPDVKETKDFFIVSFDGLYESNKGASLPSVCLDSWTVSWQMIGGVNTTTVIGEGRNQPVTGSGGKAVLGFVQFVTRFTTSDVEVPNGNDMAMLPANSFKFDLVLQDWPFSSAQNTLAAWFDVKAKGMYKVKKTKAKQDKWDRIDIAVDDATAPTSGFIDIPDTCTIGGVTNDVTVDLVTTGNKYTVVVALPYFAPGTRLVLDPILSLGPSPTSYAWIWISLVVVCGLAVVGTSVYLWHRKPVSASESVTLLSADGGVGNARAAAAV